MTWKCIMCKKTVEIDLGKVGMKCPFCDGKIFIKERPTTAKRITYPFLCKFLWLFVRNCVQSSLKKSKLL